MEQKLNAVICALNSQYIHSSLSPWCLLAGVKAYCAEDIAAEVVEGTVNENAEAVLSRIIKHKPEVVGFSCYIWNIGAVKALIRLVKNELPDALILLGGPEVSYNAAEILKDEPLVDYVISGEGERPFALLLNAICQGQSADGIPGVSYRMGGEAVTAQPYVSDEDPPSPYSEQYLGALRGRIAYLETSRGCPFSCAFCLSGYGSVRFFGMERTKREMLLLANSGTRTVKLVDRTFNADRKRAAELFRFIIANYKTAIPEGVCFHFEIGGDLLDTETIDLLGSAPPGLIQLEIGIQSLNAETLDAVNRKTDIGRLKSNIKSISAKGNIHVHVDLIAGLPHEDLSSFADGFNAAYELGADMLQLGFLKLLCGSPMQKNRQSYPGSFNESAPYEVLETPRLSSEELRFLHLTEGALDRLYNSGRFRRTLSYILKQTEVTPFELFSAFGEYLGGRERGIPLDALVALVFRYFSEKPEIDGMTLRDAMVCDYLATNSSCRLPPALRIEDPELKKIKHGLGSGEGRRAVALLYSEPCAVYADYKNKNPVTGDYALTKIPL